ncbi:hypothetical protein Q5752_002069 [Cryptotrichosporon argae]
MAQHGRRRRCHTERLPGSHSRFRPPIIPPSRRTTCLHDQVAGLARPSLTLTRLQSFANNDVSIPPSGPRRLRKMATLASPPRAAITVASTTTSATSLNKACSWPARIALGKP